MIAKGTFELTMQADPPYDTVDGVVLTRIRFDKRFSGALEATSVVNMMGARTPIEDSAGYVALERVTGTLDSKRGTFVLQHLGVMSCGAQTLAVTVVPASGTGDLKGLSGRMEIQIVEGQHLYTLDYRLAE